MRLRTVQNETRQRPTRRTNQGSASLELSHHYATCSWTTSAHKPEEPRPLAHFNSAERQQFRTTQVNECYRDVTTTTSALMTNSDQKQGLVILLQTVLVYLLHDQLPNVRQGLCGVFRQQLF